MQEWITGTRVAACFAGRIKAATTGAEQGLKAATDNFFIAVNQKPIIRQYINNWCVYM